MIDFSFLGEYSDNGFEQKFLRDIVYTDIYL